MGIPTTDLFERGNRRFLQADVFLILLIWILFLLASRLLSTRWPDDSNTEDCLYRRFFLLR